MCGLGVAVGCKSGHKKRLMCGAGWLTVFKALESFKRLEPFRGLERFKGFRAGKRQTWMPIRSH